MDIQDNLIKMIDDNEEIGKHVRSLSRASNGNTLKLAENLKSLLFSKVDDLGAEVYPQNLSSAQSAYYQFLLQFLKNNISDNDCLDVAEYYNCKLKKEAQACLQFLLSYN